MEELIQLEQLQVDVHTIHLTLHRYRQLEVLWVKSVEAYSELEMVINLSGVMLQG